MANQEKNEINNIVRNMREHAQYIIELVRDEPNDDTALIHAYDHADNLFSAKNVLMLIDALETAETEKLALTQDHRPHAPLLQQHEPFGYLDGNKHGMCYEPRHKDRLREPVPLYSEMSIQLNQTDAKAERITPMLPVRDNDGCWCHPGRIATPFDLTGGSNDEYAEWYAARGMESKFTYMKHVFCEDCNFGKSVDIPILHWNPVPPAGKGWILTCIFDTEDDGGCAEWIRYTDTDL